VSVDVVLVHFGDPEPTVNGVARLGVLSPASVTVVDNSANLPAVPGARVLAPGANVGFGAGVNLGASAGRAPWLLVLNPDAQIGRAAVDALLAAGRRDPRLAVLAPRLLYADGSEQINGGRFSGWPREVSRCLGAGRWVRGVRARARREATARGDGPIARPWVTAAAVLIRRTAFEEVGGFDERFFLYYEDEDLCRRLRTRGWRAGVCPSADARHAVGGSTGQADPYRSPHFEASRAQYHRVHSGPVLRTVVALDARRRIAQLRRDAA